MFKAISDREVFVQPGSVMLPGEPSRLCAVVSYGVAFAVYDSRRKMGGMGYYLYPVRRPEFHSTAHFAGPAIVSLLRLFNHLGTPAEHLEAFLCGGAANSAIPELPARLGAENVQVGRELMQKLGIRLAGTDVGGTRARKFMFCSTTGETMVSRVDRVRENDWIPPSF
jgi:chemotaxis protein CheD